MENGTITLTELRNLASSLKLPDRNFVESNDENEGCKTEKAKAYALVLKAAYLWNKTDEERFQVLAVALGTLLYRYSGQENIPLISISNHCGETKEKMTQEAYLLTFGRNSSFQDVLAQLPDSKLLLPEDQSMMEYEKNSDQAQNLFRFGFAAASAMTQLTIPTSFEAFLTLKWMETSKEPSFLLSIDYKSDIYAQSQMEFFATHLANILESLSPSSVLKPVQMLSMLSDDERFQVLTQFNQINPDDLGFLEHGTTLLGTFERNVETNGDKLALIDDSGNTELKLSYRQLHAHARNLSERLRTASLRNSSSFIAIFLPMGCNFISASLATLILGKTAAILHTSYSTAQLESCLKQLDNPVLVTTRRSMESTSVKHNAIFLIDEHEISSLETSVFQSTPITKSNPNPYCFFTSGTTGLPKAVMMTSVGVLNAISFLVKKFDFCESDVTASLSPPGFGLTICDPWIAFYASGTLCVPSEDVRLNLQKLKAWLYKRSITTFWVPTAIGDALLRFPPEDAFYFSKVCWISVAGERLPGLNITGQNFGCAQGYGSTETFLNTLKVLPPKCEWPSVGHSITNMKNYVLDSNLNPVPIGVNGDIYASGIGLMTGYYGRSSDSVFIDNPFEPGSKMYPLGDIGHWTEDGELVVIGRKDSQVKVHGIRLELGEVESVISQYPGIKQAIVILQDFGKVNQLVSFCTLNDGAQKPEMKPLYAFLESRLQRHAIPLFIQFVLDFPKTASCKVARNVLSGSSKITHEDEKVISFAHGRVRQVWAEVIGLPESIIKQDSNFFGLGGNSMHAVRLTQILSWEFPYAALSKIFAFPSLAEYVDSISNQAMEEVTPDFESDAKLDLTAFMKSLPDEVPLTQIKDVLVTGGTGYMGPMLLIQILSSMSCNVVSIVRALSHGEATKRLETAFISQGLGTSFEKFKNRIQVLSGDVSENRFGLNSSEYDLLCQRVDSVYHAAAEVNFVKSYSQLRESTVAMAKNVIQFSVSRKLKPIHYVSTVGVFDGIPVEEGDVYIAKEVPLPPESRPEVMQNGYNQSKWVGEQLIWKAIEQGVPAKIYRVGEIGASTKEDIVNREDAFAGFLLSCKKIKKYPNIRIKMPYVSLDATAEWIVKISLNVPVSTKPHVFHIVEQELDLESFLQADKECEYEIVTLDQWEETFLSQTHFKGKESVGAWLLLKSIKSSTEGDSIGCISRNIEFSVKETENLVGRTSDENNLASIYVQRLFK